MTQFERVTKDIDSLVEFIATAEKGENGGCESCSCKEECTGNETCKRAWKDYLCSEV
jgi:hypothetical protein